MTLGRREFLQRSAAALAALGVGDAALTGLGQTYQQALASTSRRLALLVGINQYPDTVWQEGAPLEKGALLQGALTDVELQRELLFHRFGVPAPDILTLVDDQATTPKILEAIQGHLVDQVRPGDLVIVHFSGLGSQVQLAGHPPEERLPTLVTVDSDLPKEADPRIRDLFEESIAQGLGRIPGGRVVTVLDAGHGAPRPSPYQGNFRVRSRLTVPTGTWTAEGSPLLKGPSKTLAQLATTWPGLLLRPTQAGIPALEGNWPGFSAGLFTYALTQQVWASVAPPGQSWFFYQVGDKMSAWTGSEVTPQVQGQLAAKGKRNDLLLTGDTPHSAADGIVQHVNTSSKTATLWLGGIADSLLPYGTLGLRLQAVSQPGVNTAPPGTVTLKVIEGLRAKADFTGSESLPIGTPLVEIERTLPREVSLTVALDPALERIERVDATSALAGIPYITATSPGEQKADCLFGRVRLRPSETDRTAPSAGTADSVASSPPAQPGYGLFSPDHTLIPGTAAEEEEAVKTAVSRLSMPLSHLLAVKLLRLTTNPVSSQLPLRLTLQGLEPASRVLLTEATLRARQLSQTDGTNRAPGIGSTKEKGGRSQRCQIRMQNLGRQPLYYLLLWVTDKNRLSVYCPPTEVPSSEGEQTSKTLAEASQLLPGGNLQFPRLADNSVSSTQFQGTEIFAIACTQPFYGTWKALRTPTFRQPSDRFAPLADPLPITKAIVNDLHRASLPDPNTTTASQESLIVLRSHAWATLSLRSPFQTP